MAKKGQAQVAAYAGGLAVAIGLGGIAVIALGKGTWQTAKNVGAAASNATSGLPDLGMGVGSVTTGAGNLLNTAGSFTQTQQGSSMATATAAEFSAAQPQLRIQILGVTNRNTGGKKYTQVRMRAMNGSAPVAYAQFTGVPNKAMTRSVLGAKIERVADAAGVVSVHWTVGDVPFTDAEDDITWTARKAGFNPSPSVTVT